MRAPRKATGRYRDWAAIVARTRLYPNVWAVRLSNEPVHLARQVRDKRAPELHLEDGYIQARVTNGHTNELGERRGDVTLRFVPKEN